MSRSTTIIFVALLSLALVAIALSWTRYSDEEDRRQQLADDELSSDEITALHLVVREWLAEVQPTIPMQDAATFDQCYEQAKHTREITKACEINRFSNVAFTNLVLRPNNRTPCDNTVSIEVEYLYEEYRAECSNFLAWPEERFVSFQLENDVDHLCYTERVITVATYIELYAQTRRRLLDTRRIESALFNRLVRIAEGRRHLRLAIGDRSAANSAALVQYAEQWTASDGSIGSDAAVIIDFLLEYRDLVIANLDWREIFAEIEPQDGLGSAEFYHGLGFASGDPCHLFTYGGAGTSLEGWAYSFWLRRFQEGTFERTAAVLEALRPA